MLFQRVRHYVYTLIAAEISRLTRYDDVTVQIDHLDHDDGILFDAIEAPNKQKRSMDRLDPLTGTGRSSLIINGNLNYSFDIEAYLGELKKKLNREARVVCIIYNHYLQWLYRAVTWLRWRKSPVPTVFLTAASFDNIARLSGYEVVRLRTCGYCPWRLFGLGDLINYILPAIPFLKHFSFSAVATLRPLGMQGTSKASLSIVIPARNEKGNIEAAVTRLAPFLEKVQSEVIFVEGHSTDQTWEEIERVRDKYQSRFKIEAFQQTGKGKVDAVRLGFAQASMDLLTILDADLTMPPELLHRFYDAYCEGHADFVNGSRLVYPMESDSMRFLNRLGNIFFAKALSFVLDGKFTDSLCGTKLLRRSDYQRFVEWRRMFGDFDPFGDFELIFPAAILGLGVVDIPIRYRSRSYGSTNISRFRHGLVLLRMTLIGFFKIKCGYYPERFYASKMRSESAKLRSV